MKSLVVYIDLWNIFNVSTALKGTEDLERKLIICSEKGSKSRVQNNSPVH